MRVERIALRMLSRRNIKAKTSSDQRPLRLRVGIRCQYPAFMTAVPQRAHQAGHRELDLRFAKVKEWLRCHRNPRSRHNRNPGAFLWSASIYGRSLSRGACRCRQRKDRKEAQLEGHLSQPCRKSQGMTIPERAAGAQMVIARLALVPMAPQLVIASPQKDTLLLQNRQVALQRNGRDFSFGQI